MLPVGSFFYIVDDMSLSNLLRFVILAGIFATPFICLIVAESMFFPFITGKNFTFRVLVEIMLGFWALLMLVDATYRPKFSWILVAIGTFLGVMTVADFLGENPARSLWSNYERMEGLVTIVHLFLYFIISASVLATENAWKWFWRTSIGASMFVAIQAFYQLAGKAEIHQGSTRLDATFGNSTYLAVYALFHAFLAMFLFFRDGKQNSMRWIYPATALINFVVLFYTQTRGSLLGFIGGAFLVLLLIALFDKEHPEWKKFAVGGVVGVLLLIAGFIAIKDSAFVQGSQTLQRMASISINDATTNSRFMIWNMSWEGFKERPLLGWGQDNFLYVFAKHYNPKMWNQEPWFDRSHNVFFDWLIAGGALGLLSYLSMFGAVLYYLWFAKKKHLTIIERSILTGMLAGYFVHNIFVFDNLTSYIVFFGILAYLHTLHAERGDAPVVEVKPAKKSHQKEPKEELEAGDLAIAGVVILAITFGINYFVNVRNINANFALINSLRQEGMLVAGDTKGEKKIAMKAVLDLNLFGTGEAREQLVQIALQTQDPRVPADIRSMFHDLAADEFTKSLAEDPNNVRTLSFAGTFYSRFGEYDKALPLYTKAIELSPKRQSIYVDFSGMNIAMGNFARAEELAKTAYELERANNEAALTYVATLIYQNKSDLVAPVLKPFSDTAVAYDNRIVNAYVHIKQYQKAIELLNEKIARGYAGGRDYFTLAGIYLELGQKDSAIASVEKAMSLDASLKEQGEQAIKEIKNKGAVAPK